MPEESLGTASLQRFYFLLVPHKGLTRPHPAELSTSDQIGHTQGGMDKMQRTRVENTNKEPEGRLGRVQMPRFEKQFGKRIDKTG